MFSVGDKVVYPHHGAAEVVACETRALNGEQVDYLVIVTHDGETRILVPADRCEVVGVRPPVPAREVPDVCDVLSKREVREPSNWSRRLKNHQAKLKSGDVFELAEVVRNLSLRQRSTDLSHAEADMLKRSRRMLVSELCYSLDVDEPTAEQQLENALA